MSLIAVGRFVGVFGVRGELKCRPTPAGELTLASGEQYVFAADGSGPRVTFAELRRVGGRLVTRLDGVESVEAATPFVGRELYAERSRIVLGPGEFLDEDLIGLHVVDPYGTELGIVASVDHYPAQDCLVLEGRRGLVPMIKPFVKRIDLAERTILVTVPPGLIEP